MRSQEMHVSAGSQRFSPSPLCATAMGAVACAPVDDAPDVHARAERVHEQLYPMYVVKARPLVALA